MLKTPEDFCQLVLEVIQVYRSEFPKLLKYDIIVPTSYLKTIEDYSTLKIFKEKVDAWWKDRKDLSGLLFFNFHTDGGLCVNVTHHSEAPIMSWSFANTTASLVSKLVSVHRRMIGDGFRLMVPRVNVSEIQMCAVFDTIAGYMSLMDRDRLCVTMKKDYLCVYMEAF